MKLDLTILTMEQIFGNKRLEIFKKRGTKAAISDFAILLGGYVFNNFYANDIEKLENRTGWYWTKTDDGTNDARVVYCYGNDSNIYVTSRRGGCRAALPFSSISSTFSNRERGTDGILEVEFGEYPQTAVSKTMQQELESLFQRGFLQPTGKKYTTDSVKYHQYNQPFQRQEHIEYEYNGKKYVRVKVNSCFNGNKFTLSNGEQYQNGDYVWVEVQPIRYFVDEEEDIAVSEKLLFAGVQFNEKSNYKGDFNTTTMKWFLDNCFAKDIIPSKIAQKEKVEIPNVTLQPETRNPIMTEANIPYKPGTNITLTLPEEWINVIDTITVQSNENPTKQVVYTKKKVYKPKKK